MERKALRILLVEDSASDAELLEEALYEAAPDEFVLTRVQRLQEALKVLHPGTFDALLLDLSLPDSSGPDTFLRARAAAPEIPIIVLTGWDDESLGAQALRQGVQDYLIKGQTDGRQIARSIRYSLERKKLEMELAKVQSELEQRVVERTAALQETIGELEHFSYTITHDMRAPLRAMQGFGNLLLEECPGLDPAHREMLRRIAQSADRMDKLITDALNYSGVLRQSLEIKPVEPTPLLRGIIESYPQFQSPRARIEIEKPLPRVMGNEAAMTQCFSNLLGNAVKFVAPGVIPEIKIWSEPRAEFVRIWIGDNGIGIKPEHQKIIWEMFQQLNRRYEGTGIGLSLVRKVVQRMGGHVGVESSQGKGSRFWVELRPPA